MTVILEPGSEPLRLNCGAGLTVANLGPDTVYYGSYGSITADTAPNTLAADDQRVLTDTQFLLVAATAEATQIETAHQEVNIPSGGLIDAEAAISIIKEAPINVEYAEYGADAAANDNTSAIQAAINACPQTGDYRGGEILLPNSYACASGLDLDDKQAIRLIGLAEPAPRNKSGLRYTGGAGSGTFLSCRSSSSLRFENLKIVPTVAAYDGDFIDFDWSASNQDAGGFVFENCSIGAHDSSNNARSLLRLNKTIIGLVKKTSFFWGQVGARVGDPNYAVNVTFDPQCTFNYQSQVQMMLGATEALSLRGVVFEALSNGKSGGVDSIVGQFSIGLSMLNCWAGDAAGTPGFWARLRMLGGTLIGNRFAYSGSGGTDYALGLMGGTEGCLIAGNRIESAWGIQMEPDPGTNGYVYSPAVIGNSFVVGGTGQGIKNVSSTIGRTCLANSGNAVTNHIALPIDMNDMSTFRDGLATKVIAAAVNDGYFDTNPPPDGTMAVDSANNRIYVRVGGVWKYAALT